ncbi:MAG: class I SAM-dependent methyltransferase [Candidatus Staskawiczbacteria bacterium]|nr:class I SAM-dependent methyltransferase [Candidatus Staskawiczbacteria bacterium]
MAVFQKYADYYDEIYLQKDYKKEVAFLTGVIKKYSPIKVKSILSLGCGTASHDIVLAKKGFDVLGIDGSSKMIEIAKQKTKAENVKIDFKVADVSNFKTAKKFDFAMAMFNIAGYMIENNAMENMLKNVSKSLKKGSLLVFDAWYGPAVLKDRPQDREKKFAKDGKEITRLTTQTIDTQKSIIDITFTIKEGTKKVAQENHPMRFWYLKEMEYFLNKNGFKMVKMCNFMDLKSTVSENKWDIFVIAEKTR